MQKPRVNIRVNVVETGNEDTDSHEKQKAHNSDEGKA